MIALLTGILLTNQPDECTIDVQGVGYAVAISKRTASGLPEAGHKVRLHIYTYVREDRITLFGFDTLEDRALFQRLLTVSGIGPRMAVAILSGFAPSDLVQVVAGEDAAQLSSIPGVGKKTAERIIVDLRDRLLKDHAKLLQMPTAGAMKGSLNTEALSALVNLGYPQATALDALRKIKGGTAGRELGAVIKEALKTLADL